MDLWFRTLSYRDRGKLKMHRTSWGRHGGNIIAMGRAKGRRLARKQGSSANVKLV